MNAGWGCSKMTAPRIISLVFVLFLAVVGELCAQDTLVVPGARVRVYSPDRLTGTIEMLSPDTLVLRLEARRSLQAIPFASITRLEVSRGRKSNVGKGARIGLAVGARFIRPQTLQAEAVLDTVRP